MALSGPHGYRCRLFRTLRKTNGKSGLPKRVLVVLAQDNRIIAEMRDRVRDFGIPSKRGWCGCYRHRRCTTPN
jgi:hypothetical protein